MSYMNVTFQTLEKLSIFQHSYNKNSTDIENAPAENLRIGVKVEEDESESSGSDKESIPEAEYVSAKCVIFTYFTGDTNSVVEDHFAKALNQPSSFTSDSILQPSKKSINDDEINNNGPLMSQRVFPPSFWSSNYYSITGSSNISPELSTIFNETVGSSINRPDPWQYNLAPSPYNNRPITDVGYGGSSNNGAVFNPRYSSLLIQPYIRPSRLPGLDSGHCDYKPSDPGWSIAYANPHSNFSTSYAVENGTVSSVTDNQEFTKDPFWF